MRAVKRLVPATTNNLTKAIIEHLNSKGHFAFRINNGAVYDPVKNVFRRKRRDDPAVADIYCLLAPSGVSLWIEVKNAATGDKAKSAQKKFAEEVRRRGGYHFFAKRFVDFLAWYSNNIFDNTDDLGAGPVSHIDL